MLGPPVALVAGLIGIWRDQRRVWAIVATVIAFLTLTLMGYTYLTAGNAKEDFIESCRLEYLDKEGFTNRGPLFYQYVGWLDAEQPFPPTMKGKELLDLIGPPNLWIGDQDNQLYLYRYNCSTNGPSEVTIEIRNGVVWSYMYCTQGVNGHSNWRDFKKDPPPKVVD